MHIPRYLRTWLVPSPRSVAGVPLDEVGRFRTSLLLRTMRMRSWCNCSHSACGVAVIINKNKKNLKERKGHNEGLTATGPGFCGPPHYCAPLVCVPDVMGGLAVWRYDNAKTKNQVRYSPPKKEKKKARRYVANSPSGVGACLLARCEETPGP